MDLEKSDVSEVKVEATKSKATLIIDGFDLSDTIQGMILVFEDGHKPYIDVRLPLDSVSIDAPMTVGSPGEVDVGQIVKTFLQNVDMSTLDKKVMDSLGWGSNEKLTEATVRILLEVAEKL